MLVRPAFEAAAANLSRKGLAAQIAAAQESPKSARALVPAQTPAPKLPTDRNQAAGADMGRASDMGQASTAAAFRLTPNNSRSPPGFRG